MLYNRLWFHKDRYGFTLGGGKINNPGRYLVLLPPINGATATSGTPYFTENPGDPFKAWDVSATFDYMPSQYITFRWEFDHRQPMCRTGPAGAGLHLREETRKPGSVHSGSGPGSAQGRGPVYMAIMVKF